MQVLDKIKNYAKAGFQCIFFLSVRLCKKGHFRPFTLDSLMKSKTASVEQETTSATRSNTHSVCEFNFSMCKKRARLFETKRTRIRRLSCVRDFLCRSCYNLMPWRDRSYALLQQASQSPPNGTWKVPDINRHK